MTETPLLPRLHAATLHALAWLAGRLPYRWLRAAGRRLGDASARRNSRAFRITRRNLELTGQAHGEAGAMLARRILRDTYATLLESLRVWTRPDTDGLRLVTAVEGQAHFDAAAAHPAGMIIATPHYGNWELLARHLASLGELAVLYRPPDTLRGDLFIRRMRSHPRITQVRADAGGVRELVRRLRAGGRVGILPDQQPKQGEGAFAPFFGQPALTMTLLPRLAASSGAALLLAYAERGADGGYRVHFEPLPAAVAGRDAAAVAVLNAAVEAVARRDPGQYQWTYKRFKLRPPGATPNPYWPDCYGRAARRGDR